MSDDQDRETFIKFCKSNYAERLEPWALEELAKLRWQRRPAVGTFKSMAAAIMETVRDEKK